MQLILGLTAGAVFLTGLLGALVLQAIRRRSLLSSIVVAALAPVAAVSAAVALNVNRMVISQHDSTVVSVALGFSTVLAVALSYALGRRVASGSRELTRALRGLAEGPYVASAPAGGGSSSASASHSRSSAPAEITALATELETTRESLRLSRERERSLEQSRRELVAFMSHDLRTPLAGLRALTEGLEDGVIEDQDAALRQMRQTVERMNSLVGDLFELSRLNAGPARPAQTRGPLSLVELAYDVVGEAREQARRRHVDLVLEVADEADRLAVQGNGDELARALSNLIGNAVRHTREHGRVVVSAVRASDGRARLAVTDGCGGIEDDDLARVFEIGWRGEPERGTSDAGAGLGLAIARGVIESHAGSISVANVDGGCRFDVELPTHPPA
ncbi:MAG: HAMP domain-containing histidine kinase [Phycicoccus sp.]|nr:HAMP domain-containing histidine kinase [Phycicoccus sp.]